MKAIEVLDWIIRESIDGVILNIVTVPNEGVYSWEQNEGWWKDMFGACPPHPVEQGAYLYYYRSATNAFHEYITDANGNIKNPDAEIELQPLSDVDYIYLYKLED